MWYEIVSFSINLISAQTACGNPKTSRPGEQPIRGLNLLVNASSLTSESSSYWSRLSSASQIPQRCERFHEIPMKALDTPINNLRFAELVRLRLRKHANQDVQKALRKPKVNVVRERQTPRLSVHALPTEPGSIQATCPSIDSEVSVPLQRISSIRIFPRPHCLDRKREVPEQVGLATPLAAQYKSSHPARRLKKRDRVRLLPIVGYPKPSYLIIVHVVCLNETH